MRAILSAEVGGPDSLELREIERPEPKRDEVLVRVKVAALNFFDCLIIEDKYQIKPPRPFPIAAEMAGVVEAVGEGVETLAKGDRVCGPVQPGASQEYVAVPAAVLSQTPDGVSDEHAAAITITYGTSYHALKDRAGLREGETCAVLGASGGVGQAAVELAKITGAKVIACASSQDKIDFAKSCGADSGINYSEVDLKDALKQETGGKGVDVIYDPVGGDLAEAAFRAIAWEGRYLVIGFAAGPIPKLPLNLPLLKGADIRGVFWGAFTRADPQTNRGNVEQLLAWLADGTLKPHVDSVFALEEAANALKKIASRDVKGKVLLRISD